MHPIAKYVSYHGFSSLELLFQKARRCSNSSKMEKDSRGRNESHQKQIELGN